MAAPLQSEQQEIEKANSNTVTVTPAEPEVKQMIFKDPNFVVSIVKIHLKKIVYVATPVK